MERVNSSFSSGIPELPIRRNQNGPCVSGEAEKNKVSSFQIRDRVPMKFAKQFLNERIGESRNLKFPWAAIGSNRVRSQHVRFLLEVPDDRDRCLKIRLRRNDHANAFRVQRFQYFTSGTVVSSKSKDCVHDDARIDNDGRPHAEEKAASLRVCKSSSALSPHAQCMAPARQPRAGFFPAEVFLNRCHIRQFCGIHSRIDRFASIRP